MKSAALSVKTWAIPWTCMRATSLASCTCKPPDPVGHEQDAPGLVSGRAVRNDAKEPLDDAQPPIGVGDRQAESPAGRHRSRADVPEFGRVLGGHNEGIAAAPQRTHRTADDPVLGIGRLQEPEQDARVDEDEHQSWSA